MVKTRSKGPPSPIQDSSNGTKQSRVASGAGGKKTRKIVSKLEAPAKLKVAKKKLNDVTNEKKEAGIKSSRPKRKVTTSNKEEPIATTATKNEEIQATKNESKESPKKKKPVALRHGEELVVKSNFNGTNEDGSVSRPKRTTKNSNNRKIASARNQVKADDMPVDHCKKEVLPITKPAPLEVKATANKTKRSTAPTVVRPRVIRAGNHHPSPSAGVRRQSLVGGVETVLSNDEDADPKEDPKEYSKYAAEAKELFPTVKKSSAKQSTAAQVRSKATAPSTKNVTQKFEDQTNHKKVVIPHAGDGTSATTRGPTKPKPKPRKSIRDSLLDTKPAWATPTLLIQGPMGRRVTVLGVSSIGEIDSRMALSLRQMAMDLPRGTTKSVPVQPTNESNQFCMVAKSKKGGLVVTGRERLMKLDASAKSRVEERLKALCKVQGGRTQHKNVTIKSGGKVIEFPPDRDDQPRFEVEVLKFTKNGREDSEDSSDKLVVVIGVLSYNALSHDVQRRIQARIAALKDDEPGLSIRVNSQGTDILA